MTQTLFESYNEMLERWYGRKASTETFKAFLAYCERGEAINGVKPKKNPWNLYAFGNKMPTETAMAVWRLRNYGDYLRRRDDEKVLAEWKEKKKHETV